MYNIYLYYFKLDKNFDNNSDNQVSSTEIFVPLFMMWTLCMIHSQIVATNPGSEKSRLKLKSHNTIKKKCSKFKYAYLYYLILNLLYFYTLVY